MPWHVISALYAHTHTHTHLYGVHNPMSTHHTYRVAVVTKATYRKIAILLAEWSEWFVLHLFFFSKLI